MPHSELVFSSLAKGPKVYGACEKHTSNDNFHKTVLSKVDFFSLKFAGGKGKQIVAF